MFCVLSTIFMSSTHTDKNKCILRWLYSHSHPRTFSHPFSNRTFSFLSHKSPANGWLACTEKREQSWNDVQDFCRRRMLTPKHLAPWIRRSSWNHPSHCYLSIPLVLCTFETFAPIQSSWDDTCPLMLQNELSCHQMLLSFHLCFTTLDSSLAGSFCNFVHSLLKAAFASRICIALGMRIGLFTILWCDVETWPRSWWVFPLLTVVRTLCDSLMMSSRSWFQHEELNLFV